MSPRAFYAIGAALGCIGLLALAAGGMLTIGALAGGALPFGGGATPVAADVEAALRDAFEHPRSEGTPRTSVEVHSVEIGETAEAGATEIAEGVPAGRDVTGVVVDYTVRTHRANLTRAVRRVRDAKAWRDDAGRWRVTEGTPRGDDVNTEEPPG